MAIVDIERYLESRQLAPSLEPATAVDPATQTDATTGFAAAAVVPPAATTSAAAAASATPSVGGSTCGAAVDASAYNLPFHVGSVFIILTVSALACSFPIIVAKFPRIKTPHNFLFGVRHFGTGVLIATAFVHLLPTAFTSLTDPCLPPFWNQTYPAMAGVIAMGATFLITIIEMVFSGRQGCTFPAEMMTPNLNNNVRTPELGSKENPNSIMGVLDNESRPGRVNTDDSERTLTPSMETKKKLLQCVLLEAGILFHSVFIGMSLAVTFGDDFIVLLVAVAFHQTFEGLALGSRIAAIDWDNHPRGKFQPWLMALAYGCTTPIGQALGIGTRSLYDPASETGLLVVGIMNSISSGLLIFAALVELLAEDFLSDQSWEIMRGKRRVIACILVFLGAFGMALIGAWA